jgi:hypothetical protein
LQAEWQEIDVRRDRHYARSRREAPRSPCTLGSLRPLRAEESAHACDDFPHDARSRRGTLWSLGSLWSLGPLWSWVSLRSLGSGESGDARGTLGSDRPLDTDSSLDTGDARGTLGSDRPLGSGKSGKSGNARGTLGSDCSLGSGKSGDP